MAGKNIDALDNFDDLEYNARQTAHPQSQDVSGVIQENVVGIMEKPLFNLEKMSIGDIKQWTGVQLKNGTIINRLKQGKVWPDRMTGKYNLSNYAREQVIDVLGVTLAPRPDAIEIAGSKEKYRAGLSLRRVDNLLDAGGFKNSSAKRNQY